MKRTVTKRIVPVILILLVLVSGIPVQTVLAQPQPVRGCSVVILPPVFAPKPDQLFSISLQTLKKASYTVHVFKVRDGQMIFQGSWAADLEAYEKWDTIIERMDAQAVIFRVYSYTTGSYCGTLRVSAAGPR